MYLDRRTFVASLLLRPWRERRTSAAGLQARLDLSMGGHQGAAVVLDIASGKVLAQHRLDAAARRLVAPGSAIKPFVMASLIESNSIQPNTRHQCGRTLRIAGRKLDCSHVDTGEAIDPVHALAYSCNSFFAEFAGRLMPPLLVRNLASFGLTSSTRLAASEVTGRIAIPRDTANLQLLALGEANIQLTLPEMAAAYRRLALIRKQEHQRAQQLALIFEGLSAATEYGTARLARTPSVAIAGKTGTATEQAGIRSHAWFAGYAPAETPEIVVVVFLETGSGGGDAAPIARQILEAL